MGPQKAKNATSVAAAEVWNAPVDQLLLDVENPRLASGSGGETQEDLIRVLWTEMAVDEVAFSVAANGFFREEPLLVIPAEKAKGGKDKYIVVEGNRRLAAVLLLRDAKLREKLKVTGLPAIDSKRHTDLDTIPVFRYPDRERLWTFCGFRHINGAKPWDAFSKAQYVATVHEQYHVPLDEIAKKIGDRHATVRRLYRGYKVLEQAEERAGFSKEDRVRNRFYFSHLYTAVDQTEFQKFLGIDAEKSLKPNPVPHSKLPELKELMTFLYGQRSTGKEPLVRTQAPDLNILREVISKPAALSAIRSGLSLERAYDIGTGDKRRFRDSLTRAKEELQQAKGTVTKGYSGEEDLYETITDIELYASKIKEEMEDQRKKKK
jgi:hypothetical protein